nr:hypothetical protein GCM10020092_085280 [Actinoplanes digitatis]
MPGPGGALGAASSATGLLAGAEPEACGANGDAANGVSAAPPSSAGANGDRGAGGPSSPPGANGERDPGTGRAEPPAGAWPLVIGAPPCRGPASPFRWPLVSTGAKPTWLPHREPLAPLSSASAGRREPRATIWVSLVSAGCGQPGANGFGAGSSDPC